MTPFILLLVLSQNPFDGPYCKMFKEGWKTGFCEGKQACIAPPAPACPVPEAGGNQEELGWVDGYKRARKAQRK